MLAENQFRALAGFFPELKERTARDIEEYTNLTHEPVYRILKSLVKTRHLIEKKVGRTNVYEPVFTEDLYLVYIYFMTRKINKFKEKHYLLHKRLREFANSIKAHSVILFGSYAKGTQTQRSDIDVLVVSRKKDIDKTARTFKTKYNISIKPLVIKPKEFRNIKTDNLSFYKDLVEFGIVLSGTEFLFEEVYKNAKVV